MNINYNNEYKRIHIEFESVPDIKIREELKKENWGYNGLINQWFPKSSAIQNSYDFISELKRKYFPEEKQTFYGSIYFDEKNETNIKYIEINETDDIKLIHYNFYDEHFNLIKNDTFDFTNNIENVGNFNYAMNSILEQNNINQYKIIKITNEEFNKEKQIENDKKNNPESMNILKDLIRNAMDYKIQENSLDAFANNLKDNLIKEYAGNTEEKLNELILELRAEHERDLKRIQELEKLNNSYKSSSTEKTAKEEEKENENTEELSRLDAEVETMERDVNDVVQDKIIKQYEEQKIPYVISEERNTVVAVGVAPTIQTLRTRVSSTALRASTTTVDSNISQSEEKSILTSRQYESEQGSNYDGNLSTTEIAKKLREYIKVNYPGYKFSVRSEYFTGGSSISVELKKTPVEIATFETMKEYCEKYSSTERYNYEKQKYEKYNELSPEEKTVFINKILESPSFYNVNRYHFETMDYMNPEVKAVFSDVISQLESYNYDHSDSQTDYFDVNFYSNYDISSEAVTHSLEIIANKAAGITTEKSSEEEIGAATKAEIVMNEKYNMPNLSFDGKPDEAMRENLKAEGWLWNGKDSVWWPRTKEAQANAQKFAESIVNSFLNIENQNIIKDMNSEKTLKTISNKNELNVNTAELSQEDIEICKKVIPPSQFKFTMELTEGEEGEFFKNKMKQIADTYRKINVDHELINKDGTHNVGFRYFLGDTEIYLSEIDSDGIGFGYNILNGDLQMSEWGSTSLEEILSIPYMEMDYHVPEGITIERMLYQKHPDYFSEYAPKEEVFNVINFTNWTYFNSEKISTKVYDVEISTSLYEQLLPSEYKERSINEDEVVCIQYRKSVVSEEQDQFLISKFNKNNFMLLQQKEIQIDDELKNKIKSICNSYIEPKNDNSYTNEIIEKIKAAGIEVVTDKDEFDRILESEAILQKMSNDDVIRNLAKERDDAIEKKNNINAEKLESFKHDVNSHSSLIKELIKSGNTLLENGFDLRHFSADGFTLKFGFNFSSGKITGVGRSLGDDGTKYYIYSDGENISIGPYTFNYDWKYDSEPKRWLEGLQSFKTQLSEFYGLNFDNVEMEEVQKNEDIELKEESIKENVNISQYQKKLLSNALKETAVDFVSVVYSRENYNKIFGDGVIESPVETIKLGSNQFIKLSPGNRNNFMYAIRQTLEKPSIILEKETWDDNSESFKPVHLYGKSFINDNNSEKVVESLIVFKEGNNIAVSLHPKGIDKFVEQIKTTNDIVYLDDEVSRVVAFAITGGDSHVVKENENFLSRVRQVSYSSLGQESYPLINKNYNRENLLSSREFISTKGIEIGKLEITKDNFDRYFNILNQHDAFKDKRNRIASELFNFHVSAENKENMKNWLEEQGYTITGKEVIQYMTNDNGLTYGFVHDGKIYLNTEIMNSNAVVHEYTHLWDAYTQKTNPELWNKGLEIFKDTKYWNEVISDPNYQDIKDDENLVLSEIHSRICGDIAEEVFNRIAELDGEQTKLDAIDWNEETWNYIKEYGLNLDVHKPDGELTFSSLHDFLSTPMKDLIASKNINVSNELNKPSEPLRVYTFSPFGYEGSIVQVETDLRRGIPAYDIVGIADSAVKETRERIRAAFANSGLEFPAERVLQSLSPADLRKDSPMDLSMALGILGQTKQYPVNEPVLALGELELSGRIRPVRGALAAVNTAKAEGITNIVCDPTTAELIKNVEGINILTAESLKEANEKLMNPENFKKTEQKLYKAETVQFNDEWMDEYKDAWDNTPMKGHFETVRAMEIAIAGKHNILTTGAPGCGKTLLTQTLFQALTPKLTEEESKPIARINSLAGLDSPKRDNTIPPFRIPHQTATIEGICGGGPNCRPGEISLAHNGILFLDEAAEFRSSVIQMLRVPLESRQITLSRAGRSTSYPADFQLVMAMNPCPCGNYGTHDKICLDSARSIEMYWKKISDPLLDRIEIKNFCKRDEKDNRNISFEQMKSAIARAYEIQRKRGVYNSHLTPQQIEQYCTLDEQGKAFVDELDSKEELTPRGKANLLKTSLTIANMEGREQIMIQDLQEAHELTNNIFAEEKHKLSQEQIDTIHSNEVHEEIAAYNIERISVPAKAVGEVELKYESANYRIEKTELKNVMSPENSYSTDDVINSLHMIDKVMEYDGSMTITNPGLGDVIFANGTVGNLEKRNNGGFGIKHIIEGRYLKDNLSNEEITAMLYLVKDAVETVNPEDTSTARVNIVKKGIWTVVSKNWLETDEKWIITGYGINDTNSEMIKEATDSIKAVIAQYGYAPEFLSVSRQVGAVTSIIDNTMRNIKLSNDSKRIENFKAIYKNSKVLQEFFDNQIVHSPKTDYIARHKEKWTELEENKNHLNKLGQQEFNFDDSGVNQDVIDAAENERKRITEPVLNGERTGMYKAFKDFEDKGVFDIQGTTVKLAKNGGLTPTGWKQLQAAMEIYRSKKFETFRYIMIDRKTGEIADQLAITSHMPNFCNVSKPNDETLKQVISRAEEKDYLIAVCHNHPSGNTTESSFDRELTDSLDRFLRRNDGLNRFAGHIILDHDTFNLAVPSEARPGNCHWKKMEPMQVTEIDRFTAEPKPEWAEEYVGGTSALKEVAVKINDTDNWNDDYIPVVFTNADRKISGVQYYSKNFFENESDKIRNEFQFAAMDAGAISAFPIITDALWEKIPASDRNDFEANLKAHVMNDAFTDVAIDKTTITEKYEIEAGRNYYSFYRDQSDKKIDVVSTWIPEVNSRLFPLENAEKVMENTKPFEITLNKNEFNGYWIPHHNAKVMKQGLEENKAPFLPDPSGNIKAEPIYNMATGYCLPANRLIFVQFAKMEKGYTSNVVSTHTFISGMENSIKENEKGVFYNFKDEQGEIHTSNLFFPEQTLNPESFIKASKEKIHQMNNLKDVSIVISSSEPKEYLGNYIAACRFGMKLSVDSQIAEEFKTKIMPILENDIAPSEKRDKKLPSLSAILFEANKRGSEIYRTLSTDKNQSIKSIKFQKTINNFKHNQTFEIEH